MTYSHEVEHMCVVKKGPNHGPAPIPEEGKWVKSKEIKDISGLTHGIGWCAPQQGACKLTLNVKEGIIQEALVETIGCSGMTHSAAMAAEILPGKTVLEALNTDLVCDAINTAMRELFLQIVYGRTQSAFSEGGLIIGLPISRVIHCAISSARSRSVRPMARSASARWATGVLRHWRNAVSARLIAMSTSAVVAHGSEEMVSPLAGLIERAWVAGEFIFSLRVNCAVMTSSPILLFMKTE